MSKNATLFLMFATGLAVGYLAATRAVRDKYAKIADDEIASVKNYYVSKYGTEAKPMHNCENKNTLVCENENEYTDIIGKLEYSSTDDSTESSSFARSRQSPHIINEEEYGEIAGYDQQSLILYEDGILADDAGSVITDEESLVGRDALLALTSENSDRVFVRNEVEKCDYEILADYGTYEEAHTKSE